MKRIARPLYYANLLKKYHINVKIIWRTINTILNRSADNTIITTTFKVDGNIITDPKYISNEFCKFVTKIGKIYADKTSPSTYQPDVYLRKKRVPNEKSMYLTPTDYNKILKILQNLKISMIT